jgi:hypothetical protein
MRSSNVARSLIAEGGQQLAEELHRRAVADEQIERMLASGYR